MPRIVATFVLPLPDNGFYGRTLGSRRDGVWTYDPELKRTPSQPIRSEWLEGAIHDIVLSVRPVRDRFADEIRRWNFAYLR